MRCYTNPHRFCAGVDLRARTMYSHVLDHQGKTVFEKDLPAQPEVFRDAVRPFREDLVVGVECMFAWYWLAAAAASSRAGPAAAWSSVLTRYHFRPVFPRIPGR